MEEWLCPKSVRTRLKKAGEVTKIVAMEMGLSLWTTDPLTNGVAETCFELDVPIIALVTLHLEAL